MLTFGIKLLLLGLFNQLALAKLIQRSFNITNIANSTWITQQTFNSRDYASCSFLCLQNISACGAFSLQDGMCEIGYYIGFIPLPDGLGRKIYRVIPSSTNGDSDYEPALPIVPGLSSFQWSYNFYRDGRLFICGAHTGTVASKACYSWLLGDSAGFALEPVQMLNDHIVGSASDMGALGFFVNGGYYSGLSSSHGYTELWQNGHWIPGPQLPGQLAEHASAQVSASKVMIMAGRWNGGSVNANSYIYDFLNASLGWVQIPSYPGTPFVRSSAAGTVTFPDGKSYVIRTGGMDAGGTYATNVAYKYDIALNTWTPIRSLPTVQSHGENILVNGQFVSWGNSGFIVYWPANDTWTNMTHDSSMIFSPCMPIPYNLP